ncbi:ATP-binding protein [Mesorhizobium sp. M1217]|uniref:AlbA family DNA-binding domain-containing protein n=1 Tax=Mesorhizobium sp. M1217 TaxID=2957070 RepID=UPI003338831C
MSIFQPVLEDVAEVDVAELVADAQHEGLSLEFKRDMYGNSDADRKEFLKDLSSFANSAGGYLVIGIDEDQGAAIATTPIAGDSDAALQRLEQIARTGIEPRIVGIRMRAVPMAAGGFVYVIRTPKSWNPPHRVSYQNSNRFYLRSSAGAHEASVEELRATFANGAAMHDRMSEYVRNRIQRIADNEGIVPLAREDGTEGRLIIHILPFAAFSGGSQIDVAAAREVANLLQPLGATGRSRINFEGFMVVRTAEVARGYTQVFRNGVIEATKVRVISLHQQQVNQQVLRVPTRAFVEPIYARLPSYMRALQALGVPPPFGISISLIEVANAFLGIGNFWDEENQQPIDRPNLVLPMQIIADFGDDASYRSAVTPALDALWNAVGLPSAAPFVANFNERGEWIGRN